MPPHHDALYRAIAAAVYAAAAPSVSPVAGAIIPIPGPLPGPGPIVPPIPGPSPGPGPIIIQPPPSAPPPNLGEILGGIAIDIVSQVRGEIWAAAGDLKGWIWGAHVGTQGHIWDAAGWVVSTLAPQVQGIVPWVTTIAGDLKAWIWGAHVGTQQNVWDAARWLAGIVQAEHAGTRSWVSTIAGDLKSWIWGAHVGTQGVVQDAAAWVVGRVEAIGEDVGSRLQQGFGWLGETVLGAIGGLGKALGDGFAWLGNLFTSGLAGAVGDIVRGFADALGRLAEILLAPFEFLACKIWEFFRKLLEELWQAVSDLFFRKLAIPLRLLRGEYTSASAFLEDLLDPPQFHDPITAFMALVAIFVSAVIQFFPILAPINDVLVQESRMRYAPRLLTPDQVLDAELRDIPVRYGYDEHLMRWGYHVEDIAALRQLRRLLPTPSDLVRMGVREVFTPEVAQAFGLFEDLPPDFVRWMARLGFDEFWAAAYWAAHWDLPSATQGFEMFHRGIISHDELRLLLRALDVMPFWRDRLIQLSYRPITRVDLRRMYQTGVIDFDRLVRGYRDLGYSPEDAEALAVWTSRAFPRASDGPAGNLRNEAIRAVRRAYTRRTIDRDEALDRLVELDLSFDEAEAIVAIWDFELEIDPNLRSDLDLRELSRSVVERAYERGLFDFNTALNELIEIGYTQEDAEVLLHLVDQRLLEELTELEIEAVLNRLDAGVITPDDAIARLRGTGLPERRVDFLVRRALLRREASPRRLTVSQLQQARRRGIIPTDADLHARLRALGYNEDDADILVALTAR